MITRRMPHRLSKMVAALAVAAVLSGPAAAGDRGIGGPFRLFDQDGRAVSDQDMRGHPFLIFFGFAHCADGDLATLSSVTEVLDQLGGDAKIGVLFVTVDPERDTPAKLKDFLAVFDPRIRGLTGDAASVDRILDAYHVSREKVLFGSGDYAVEHTTTVYLMDRDGGFVEPLDLLRADAALELRRHL